MSNPDTQVFEFAEFRLEATERLLLRNGSVVPLTPKAFETLLLLVQNSGHVVTRERLLDAVWRDSFVEENTITQNVAALRKALGERQNGHQYIETVPKLGYRFVTAVRDLTNAGGGEVLVERRTRERVVIKNQETVISDETKERQVIDQQPAGLLQRAKTHRGLSIAVITFVLIVIAASVLFVNRSNPARAEAPIKSIAVLPFKNLGNEASDEYMGVGMADALITRLGNFKEITIRPTNAVFKYRAVGQDPASAGRELGVEAVFDGSIHKSGERMRVNMQLVSVTDGATLWTDSFDGKLTDLFALQDSISSRISHAMALKLLSPEKQGIEKRHTNNAEAYEAYLKGRYFWSKSTEQSISKSIEYFEEATRIDPNYGLAYAGLAHCYNSLGSSGAVLGALLPSQVYPKARAAALRAIEIDEEIGEAYASLAHVKWNYDWDWAGAEKDFKRSIELDPNFAPTHHTYAILLAQLGRMEEAKTAIKRAQELDPVSVAIGTSAGWVFYWGRQYDEAIEQCRRALELDGNFPRAYVVMGRAYFKKGLYREAIAELQRAAQLSGSRPHALAALGLAYAAAGQRGEARKVLGELERLSKQRYLSPYQMAAIYADLGEPDRAFMLLARALEERSHPMFSIKRDPSFDSLRSDPRFAELLNRLGVAE